MPKSTSEQLRFPPIPGFTVRVDFEGGALSSDFGPLLRRGVDPQSGLTYRWAQAVEDNRHPSYLDPSLRDRLAQRIYPVAGGDEDGTDADARRTDPRFNLGLERAPLDPATERASAATFSRLEKAAPRKDIYRLAQAFVEPLIARYAKERPAQRPDLGLCFPGPPSAVVLRLCRLCAAGWPCCLHWKSVCSIISPDPC